ncbi:MAG TPA: DUF1015 family protein [Bacteroidia bacterium]|jgi:uncharacterized protein (DUF1015 family)|nr:DUF1015 family protein [Bacteroidia bacterium]
MSTVKPFRAIRPAADKVEHVVSHAVERYSAATIQHILANNPFSFLQVIYAARTQKVTYTEQLHSIKNRFDEFRTNQILKKDTEPCFYVYKQVKDGRSHIGLMALASVEEYKKGIIKIHEQTLAEREEKLKEYLTVCDFNAEPVCLTHPFNEKLHDFLYSKTKGTSLYNFSYDTIHHTIWKLSDKNDIETISELFKSIPELYIADGHHRAASSTLLAESKKKRNPAHTGLEAYNYFMAAIFAENELTIFNFNRMVNSLNGHTTESFFSAIEKHFKVIPYRHNICTPSSPKEISVYIEKQWYLLQLKDGVNVNADAVDSLDVSILSNFILGPVLNITDLRNDKRIAFIPGVKSIEDTCSIVDSGKMKAAFCLYPISFSELKAVADTGREMPPKSTWIEPKLESGLLIYSLQD